MDRSPADLEKKKTRNETSAAQETGEGSAAAAASTVLLRLRLPGASDVVDLTLEDSTEFGLLRFIIEAQHRIPADCVRFLVGFPPKPVDAASEVPIKQLFRAGELVTVQKGEAQVQRGATDGKYVPPSHTHGIFVRRVVPADNSCCFHALAYVLEDKSRAKGAELRARFAETVLANPGKFTSALLGMSPHAYATWIQQPDSWGGAIELDIASFLYQVEIISLDLQSSRIDRFGVTEGYAVRAFVVYSGTHFDALAMAHPMSRESERDDQVLFNPRDEKVMNAALSFVRTEGKR